MLQHAPAPGAVLLSRVTCVLARSSVADIIVSERFHPPSGGKLNKNYNVSESKSRTCAEDNCESNEYLRSEWDSVVVL